MSNIHIGSVSGEGNVIGDNNHIVNTTDSFSRGDGSARESAHPTSSRPREPDHAQEDANRLAYPEIVALAQAYPSPARAAALLRRAGFRSESLPVLESGASPYDYWCEVGERISHGLIAHGRHRLLVAAGHDYPANPAFLPGLQPS